MHHQDRATETIPKMAKLCVGLISNRRLRNEGKIYHILVFSLFPTKSSVDFQLSLSHRRPFIHWKYLKMPNCQLNREQIICVWAYLIFVNPLKFVKLNRFVTSLSFSEKNKTYLGKNVCAFLNLMERKDWWYGSLLLWWYHYVTSCLQALVTNILKRKYCSWLSICTVTCSCTKWQNLQ